MGAGPPSDSLFLGNTQPARRMDRHNLFTEWSNKYGSVVRRRFLDINVRASRRLHFNHLWSVCSWMTSLGLTNCTTILCQCHRFDDAEADGNPLVHADTTGH